MMGIRIDPQSGMIVQGQKRPRRLFASHVGKQKLFKKSGNMFPRQNSRKALVSDLKLPIIDLKPVQSPEEGWRQWATLIGQTIAQQLSPWLSSLATKSISTMPGVNAPIRSNTSHHDSLIMLDESVIDVGIGKTPPLQRGHQSSAIAQENIQSDNVTQAKKKLLKLKGSH